jgi:alpha-mannosidase
MSNYWNTNFASSQGGDFEFHYTLVSAPEFSAPQLTQLGWETMTKLESDPVHANAESAGLAQNSVGFLSIDNRNVVVNTWKLAEDGDRSILRLENISDQTAAVHIDTPFLSIDRAWLCNALEDKQSELPISSGRIQVTVPAFGVVTVRMETQPSATKAGGQS